MSTISPASPHATATSDVVPGTAHRGSNGFQSLLPPQTGTNRATATAYGTEPGRSTPGDGHRHHHSHGGSSDAINSNVANDSGTTRTPGGLLLSDMRRGLQAYHAAKAAG